jgi:hypothetical protein
VSAALILLAYAALVALAGPRLLGRGGWAGRSPKLGIIAWQVVACAVQKCVAARRRGSGGAWACLGRCRG